MPISNGLLWRKRSNNSGNAKFFISDTDETFVTENEMKKYEKEYAERKWVCRHLEAKGERLSLKDALEREREALRNLRKQIPDEMLAEICRIIHHSFAKKSALIETIRSKLKKCFFKGEMVSFTHYDREYEGRIRAYSYGNNVSPNDKENERTYAVEIFSSGSKVIKDVRAASIRRKHSLSDDELSCLIALVAFKRDGNNAPWIVDNEFRKLFSVPDKVHSMFACVRPTPSRTPRTVTISSSDDSEDEPSITVRHSCGLAPYSTVANKQRKTLQKKSIDKIKKEKKNMKKEKQGGDKKLIGKSCTEEAEKLIRNEEPPQKKKKKGISETANMHQRGLAKFLITTPGNNSPMVGMTPSRIGECKLEATVAKLTKALIAQDAKAFHSACAVAAKSLSLPLIKTIQNEVLRYAVMKQFEANRDAEAMKKMSIEERKEYKEKKKQERNEEHVKMERELHELLNKKLEDTVINHELPLPDLNCIEFATEERREQFAYCLVLSEFVNTFRDVLLPDCIPSAEEILNALYNGREGFFDVIGHIVVTFLKLLLQDQTGAKYGGCGVRLREVPVTLSTASELARIVLSGNKSLLEAEEEIAEVKEAEEREGGKDSATPASQWNEQHFVMQSPFVTKLRKAEFFELSASEQLKALEFLQERVSETKTLDTYRTKTVRSEIAKLEANKMAKEKEVTSLETELGEIKTLSNKPQEELTRKESLKLMRFEKRHQEITKKIEQRKESIAMLVDKIRELEVTRDNINRVKPLGSDRLHRRYWFFGKSPNTGIFVEGCTPLNMADGVLKSGQKRATKEKDLRKSSDASLVNSSQQPLNEESGGNTPLAAKKPRRNTMTLEAFINHEFTYANETGKSEWFRITDGTVLSKLVTALCDKGHRESYLLSNLRSRMDQIMSSIRAPQLMISNHNRRNEGDEGMNVADERSLLREEILMLELQLRKSVFTNIDDQQLFADKVKLAESVQLLSESILELERSLYDWAFKQKIDDCDAMEFNREEWRIFVKRAETCCASCRSRRYKDSFVVCSGCFEVTHMYCVRPPVTERPPDGQFLCNNCKQKGEEANISGNEVEDENDEDSNESEGKSTDNDWMENGEESNDDYIRRRRSRKRVSTRSIMRRAHEYQYFNTYTMVSENSLTPAEDGPRTDLQRELQEVFVKVEEDTRIYNSLITVPSVRCGTRMNDRVSLADIRKALYSYESVEDLKTDLRIFFDGAIRYFEGNERKLPQLCKLKSDLKL